MASRRPADDRPSARPARPRYGTPRASIACFISSHGYGHAARTAAVLEALIRRLPELDVDLFTTVPSWFFEGSLGARYRYHPLLHDIGLVQRNSLEEDPAATLAALDTLFPPPSRQLDEIAAALVERGCRLVLADISPLGLAVAATAGIRSVLLENFTWDWIYASFLDREPGLARHLDWLAEAFATADLHIQTEPCCRPNPGAWSVPPVSRAPRNAPGKVREALGLEAREKMVLVSMGGIAWSYDSLPTATASRRLVYVVPGGGDRHERRGGVVLLPHHSAFHHPDLVAAADLLIGKLGYSTVAETYWGRTAYLYVRRPRFAESAVLERFVRRHLVAAEIPPGDFAHGRWAPHIEGLQLDGGSPRLGVNGAEVVAERLAGILDSTSAAAPASGP